MDKNPINIRLARAARAYGTLRTALPPPVRILGTMASRADILSEARAEALRGAIQRAWSRDDVRELGDFIRGVRHNG